MARKKKSLKTRLASLSLFLVITLVVFNFDTFVEKVLIQTGIKELNWIQMAEIDIKSDLDQTLDSRAVVYTYNGNLMISASNKLTLYNENGEVINKKSINSDSRKIVGMENYFLVADVVQGNITILDYLGKAIGEVMTIGAIEDIVAVSDDFFAVVKEDDRLQIYNYQGILESEVKLSKGQLLSIDVSKDQETILVNILSSDDSQFNSQLLTYSMRSKLLIGAHNNFGTIIFGARLFRDDIIIVDDTGQHDYRLGYDEHYVWDKTREGTLVNFRIDQNGNVFEITSMTEVENYTGLSNYKLSGINKDGNELFSIELDEPYENMSLYNGMILLNSDKKVGLYQSDGVKITEKESTRKIYGCEWLTADKLLIEYNDYVEIIELAY
jgi:hypothetical protein